jgi:hypothetical protein
MDVSDQCDIGSINTLNTKRVIKEVKTHAIELFFDNRTHFFRNPILKPPCPGDFPFGRLEIVLSISSF